MFPAGPKGTNISIKSFTLVEEATWFSCLQVSCSAHTLSDVFVHRSLCFLAAIKSRSLGVIKSAKIDVLTAASDNENDAYARHVFFSLGFCVRSNLSELVLGTGTRHLRNHGRATARVMQTTL
jgi:hypothetical protein